jgi:hypothetical protein
VQEALHFIMKTRLLATFSEYCYYICPYSVRKICHCALYLVYESEALYILVQYNIDQIN